MKLEGDPQNDLVLDFEEEGFQTTKKIKLRFPILTSKQLQKAVHENILKYDDKDFIIRNPNILTVLHIKVNTDSPRTTQAMEQCGLSCDDVQVIEYVDYYEKQKKPLQNLVNYLFYLTKQYKVLTELLRKRNKIKAIDFKNQKLQKSKDIRLKNLHYSQQLDTQDQSTLILTEVPEPIKFKKVFQRPKSIESTSFLTQDDKKSLFDQRKESQVKNYNKYFGMALQHLEKKINYYSQTLPQQEEKVEKLKKQTLEAVTKKMKKESEKVKNLQEKNKEKENKRIKEYKAKIQKMDNIMEQHVEKKNRLIKEQFQSISQGKLQQEQLEQEREQRLLYQKQEEEELMNEIQGKIQRKDKQLQVQMEKRNKEIELKRQQLVETLEKKQEYVKSLQENQERAIIDDYLQRQGVRFMRVNKHEQSQLKLQKEISLKHLKQLERVQKHQENIEEKYQMKLESKVEKKAEKIENVLQRHQSLVELKKYKLMKKNQIEQQKAKVNYFKQLLDQKQKNDRLLEKSIEITNRNEQTKRGKEELQKHVMDTQQEVAELRYELLHSEKF